MSNVRMEYTGNNVEVPREYLLNKAINNIINITRGNLPKEYYNIAELDNGKMIKIADDIMYEAQDYVNSKSEKYHNTNSNTNNEMGFDVENDMLDPNIGLGTEYTRNDEEDSVYSEDYENNDNHTRDLTNFSPTSNGAPNRFNDFNENIMRELQHQDQSNNMNYMENVRGNETNITTSGSVFAPLDENKQYNTGSEIYHNPEHDNSVLENDPNYRRFREAKRREKERMMRGSPSRYSDDSNDDEECDCEDCMNSNMQNNMVTDNDLLRHMEMERRRLAMLRSNDNPKEESSMLMMLVLIVLLIGLGFAISRYTL